MRYKISLKPYLCIFYTQIKSRLIYRGGAFIEAISSLLYFYVNMSIWQVLYKGQSEKIKQMITYLLLLSVARIFASDNLQQIFAKKFKDGSLSLDFAIPLNYKRYMLSMAAGQSAGNFILFTLPVILVLLPFLFLYLSAPESLSTFIVYLVAQGMGFLIALEINFFLGQLIFQTHTLEATQFAYWSLMTLFGGRFIPLWLYPESLGMIVRWLPFHLIYSSPVAIYLGKETGIIILLQLLWYGLMILFNRMLWLKGRKYITIQGG